MQSQKKAESVSEDTPTSACLGADVLVKLLSSYCKNEDIKTSITVGVVGKSLQLPGGSCVCMGRW